jgi:hypothetical protein
MNGGWTKIMFVIGTVLDGAMAVVMLTPSLGALVWDFEQPVVDPGFRFAMAFGAALMIGWTALLAWAAAEPVERRAVAPLTILVVAGLMLAEILGMASGFLPAGRVWLMVGFQAVLIIGFAVAFHTARAPAASAS